MHPAVDWFSRQEILFRSFDDTDLAHWAGMPAQKSSFILPALCLPGRF